jgi:hypothetical protein
MYRRSKAIILASPLQRDLCTSEDSANIHNSWPRQTKVKTVEIRKKALLPLPSLQGEKCAQITSGSRNDTSNDTLPSTEISSLQEEQKHAQIGECNASNDSNDTLRGYESTIRIFFSK